MSLRAAVIIPHYEDHERLARCLAALKPQLKGDVEVLVVDNASTRPPQVPSGIRLVVEPAKGAAHARNRGVAETTAPLLLFLDCDCVPNPDWVNKAITISNRASLIGGRIVLFDETPPPRSGAEAFEAIFAFNNRDYILRKGFSVTANLVVHREAFDLVGGFRAGLSEDLDWCRRATAADCRLIYSEELQVFHPSRSDWPALRQKWRRLTDESWGLRKGNMASRVAWGLRALAMLASVLVHLPRVLRADLITVGEKKSALITMVRLRWVRCVWMLSQATTPRR